MVSRTVVGLIAEGYESNWGGTAWLSDYAISIISLVQVTIGGNPTAYLALDITPRSKIFVISQNGGNGSQNRRIGAGVVTESGDFVGIGRAFPFSRAEVWRVMQRETGVRTTLQTSINATVLVVGDQWSRFFVDGEDYACVLGVTGSEVLSGTHGLGLVDFLPGCTYQNEISPTVANLCNLRNFNAHADRYIYIYDDTIPDGYTAWVRNNTGLRVGVGAVFTDGVAIIDLLAPTLVTAPNLWTTVGIYDGTTLMDNSGTARVYGGDVFGVAHVPVPPNTPTITIDEITTLSARLNGSVFVSVDGNTHAASQWQVQLIGGDWSTPIIDTGLDIVNLLLYEIGDILDPNTYYEARVRYEDDTGLISEWSDVAQFLTLSLEPAITPCDVIEPVYAEVSQDGRASCVGTSPNFSDEDAVVLTFNNDSGCGVPPSTETC